MSRLNKLDLSMLLSSSDERSIAYYNKQLSVTNSRGNGSISLTSVAHLPSSSRSYTHANSDISLCSPCRYYQDKLTVLTTICLL